MNIKRFCIKFFTRSEVVVDDALYIDIFQKWIREETLNGTLLDVADYRHVPEGPGIMLITHEINFAMDSGNDRFGLLAQRKSGNGSTHAERIIDLVRAAAAFARELENEPRIAGGLNFEAGLFRYEANDRLLAPNTEETFDAVLPALEQTSEILYPGREVSIARALNDPHDRLAVEVDAGSASIRDLLETVRLAA